MSNVQPCSKISIVHLVVVYICIKYTLTSHFNRNPCSFINDQISHLCTMQIMFTSIEHQNGNGGGGVIVISVTDRGMVVGEYFRNCWDFHTQQKVSTQQKANKHPVRVSSVGGNALLRRKVRVEWSDWFKVYSNSNNHFLQPW